MLKILQVRLQHYMNHELSDVQAGFRKGRGTRDQIVNICWIIEKVRQWGLSFIVERETAQDRRIRSPIHVQSLRQ